ncbi:hypothetical protein GP486_004876 [Trichoglossum hirsutum]|uniref:Calcium permease n=1 Tax=Trichoglossum hirsutum TaxID=265104 RepID=A0A9P8LA83_9PEZI|nr:hypothetical protein GP486_004876 [Trichoglossum hirsutum]
MSSRDTPGKAGEASRSSDQGETSRASDPPPTGTRANQPPVQYRSIIGREQEETYGERHISTDPVRGVHRDPGMAIIATIPVLRSTSPSRTTPSDQSSSKERARPAISSDSPSSRAQVVSPERATAERPKKPSVTRKASSIHSHPHKGQEFSVDDDQSEVAEDFAQRHASNTSTAPYGSLRKRASNLRRRGTALASSLPKIDSFDGNEEEEGYQSTTAGAEGEVLDESGEEGTVLLDEDDVESELSDSESFTLKDRQEAINETHPFGIRIWKPALYKKSRSVLKTAEGDIHSSPGGRVSSWLFLFNILWTVLFGWWLAIAAAVGAAVCFCFAFAPSAVEYGNILFGLAGYLLYPFGKFVKLEQDEAYAEEDEGEGRSISEYEQWQSGDLEDGRLFFGPIARSLVGRRRNSVDSASETDSLLGRGRGGRSSYSDVGSARSKRRLFGRGQWNIGRVIFFIFFYGLVTPLLMLVSGICWLLVFWIPMGKVTMLLFYHLRRHPLAMSFHSDSTYSRGPGSPSSSIVLCTYRAVGWKYYKYTIDGTNIFFINLIGVVIFVIFDYWVLDVGLGLKIALTHSAVIFTLSLFSVIPLAYFIGQAVASISAQSSMGVGAAINAFFSTVVEVFLYCVALNEGKSRLVEGSVIGSIMAGVLLMPGLSMCFGAIKRKTQRFNAKSAGVTSTMLLFGVIAAFGPTLFYQIYGTVSFPSHPNRASAKHHKYELKCRSCSGNRGKLSLGPSGADCRRCFFSQVPAVGDRFYHEAVQPFCYGSAIALFISYIIGLWFTLRTHAAVIWNAAPETQKSVAPNQGGSHAEQRGSVTGVGPTSPSIQPTSGDPLVRSSIRDSQLYKRILGQSLSQAGLGSRPSAVPASNQASGVARQGQIPHLVPPKSSGADSFPINTQIPGLSPEQNRDLAREVAEIAAMAATVAARETTGSSQRKPSASAAVLQRPTALQLPRAYQDELDDVAATADALSHGGGHDAPNWGRTKSSVILLSATLLYAVIAEILVNKVDVVLKNVNIDEKFLGITLFALVPNTTEFLNAISFAMNGNIALSMEIGSAYALQVCLLQVPALVLYSASTAHLFEPDTLFNHTFSLIFPQWDLVTVILCVFLLSYMYGEGKSNYFKGSILILSYLVVMMGFWFSGMTDAGTIAVRGLYDSIGEEAFQTVGRGSRAGIVWVTT